MEEVKLIANDYLSRINEILDEAWKIFQSQFLNHKIDIRSEAPFQLHFANIIKSIGELYTIKPEEQFYVNREVRFDKGKKDDRPKIVDITMGFKVFEECPESTNLYKVNEYNCAIELKFKTKEQGAQNIGRINVYQDLEALEQVCKSDRYSFGKFYMITNDIIYTKEPKQNSRIKDYNISDGHKTTPGIIAKYEGKVGEKSDYHDIVLEESYEFKWEYCQDYKKDTWYFLEMPPRTK